MSLVKPPTSAELLKHYGSLKNAVIELHKRGLSADDIARKFSIPYYLIHLYLRNLEPKTKCPFIRIVKIYDRISEVRSVKGKETELAKLFFIKGLDFEIKARLALGRITDTPPKVGEGVIKRAITLASAALEKDVERVIHDYGEYGEVAYLLLPRREPTLSVDEVVNTVKILPELNSIEERIKCITSLLERSSPREAKYIVRLILQDLKIGVKERVVISAVARALGVNAELIKKAKSILGTLGAILTSPKGNIVLARVKIKPGQFVPPQLAHLYDPDKVEFPVEAEYKYDGSRLQIHKWGTKIWLFSRRAVEKSETLPEIVEIAKSFNAQSCIVDSEVIAIDKNGNFLPFQYLLTRTVPRDYEKEKAEEIGLTIKAFDILYLNGQNLMQLPLRERVGILREVVCEEFLAEGATCEDYRELFRFYNEALRRKMEGIIVKSLRSVYEPGERTYTWLKLKPERDTLDCVVVKALYGRGKRAGYYSSFLLAVRDPKEKKLYTVGKVSNIPEDIMAELTNKVNSVKIREDSEGVYIKPSIVVEVTYLEIQKAKDYSSGYALRVPKIIRIRDDKTVVDIDDLSKLEKLYSMQYDRYPIKDIS